MARLGSRGVARSTSYATSRTAACEFQDRYALEHQSGIRRKERRCHPRHGAFVVLSCFVIPSFVIPLELAAKMGSAASEPVQTSRKSAACGQCRCATWGKSDWPTRVVSAQRVRAGGRRLRKERCGCRRDAAACENCQGPLTERKRLKELRIENQLQLPRLVLVGLGTCTGGARGWASVRNGPSHRPQCRRIRSITSCCRRSMKLMICIAPPHCEHVERIDFVDPPDQPGPRGHAAGTRTVRSRFRAFAAERSILISPRFNSWSETVSEADFPQRRRGRRCEYQP